MTLVNLNKQPLSKNIRNKRKCKLLVHGQGIFIFSNSNKDVCEISILNNKKTDGLIVSFNQTNITVKILSNGKYLTDPKNSSGLLNKNGAYYWFSLDSQNTRLYAGYGETRIEDVEYKYILPSDTRNLLESLTKVSFSKNVNPLRLLRDPITKKVPLIIEDTNCLSMDDISDSVYMPVANLTPVNQQLYNCISGKNFVLDTPDFPEFTMAIERSVRTPGLWCYEKLQEKATEFNPGKPNIKETYLRITLGENNGESPGIPYVMEIWPIGHYSPIHNHSGANAIIRVLHGKINVSLYSFLCDEKDGIEPFGKVNFEKEDITWISANLNQIHKLKNLDDSVDTCITIQCYMYDKNDEVHYDYFDYIDEEGKREQYNPDMDMKFLEFKRQMKIEWDNYQRTRYKRQKTK